MAIAKVDLKYIEAKKVIENLGDSKKDEAIKYYIEKQRGYHEKDIQRLRKYEDFFKTLNSLLPNSNRKLI